MHLRFMDGIKKFMPVLARYNFSIVGCYFFTLARKMIYLCIPSLESDVQFLFIWMSENFELQTKAGTFKFQICTLSLSKFKTGFVVQQ